jgi:hypothetical protein
MTNPPRLARVAAPIAVRARPTELAAATGLGRAEPRQPNTTRRVAVMKIGRRTLRPR